MNTRQILPAALLALLALFACKSRVGMKDDRIEANPSLSGRYVNQSFLDEMSDSLGYTPRHFCLQMHFIDSQRVFIDRGFEGDTLRYKRDGDAYKLLQASPLGDMSMALEGERLVLNDSAFTGVARRSVFTRLGEGQDPAKAFAAMVNERMVSGDYELLEKGKASGRKATLSKDGSVSGLGDYVRYELCYTGDCLQTTLPYRHIIYLLKADGSRSTLAFTVEKGKSGMKLFGVGEPIPDTKGERKVMELVYDLRRS